MALEDSTPAEPIGAAQTIVMPCMDYINDADITFSISGGKAYVDGWVRGQNGIATRCQDYCEPAGEEWTVMEQCENLV